PWMGCCLLFPPGPDCPRDHSSRAVWSSYFQRRKVDLRCVRGSCQLLAIAAFGLIGLLDAYLPAYTDRKEFWILDRDAIRWLGVVLFAAGGALRIWPVFVLGHRFSGLVAIQPGHTLVTTGP